MPRRLLSWLFYFLTVFTALPQLPVSRYLGLELQQLHAKIHHAIPSSTKCLPVLGHCSPRCMSQPKLRSHSQKKHPGAQALLNEHVHHVPTTHAVKMHPAPKLA